MMRQVHRAGEKVFIDYSGRKPHIVDRTTGEVTEVELFVAVLGASNYTYAEATRSQKLADFVGSTVRMLEYFGGVPEVIVPDQLRSAVSGPDRYEPDINPTYLEMARHYGVTVIPARASKAARQGQGRGRRAHRAALDPRLAATPDLLQPCRAQPTIQRICIRSASRSAASCPCGNSRACVSSNRRASASATAHGRCGRRSAHHRGPQPRLRAERVRQRRDDGARQHDDRPLHQDLDAQAA
ncbi:hypothetical protein [Sorangium sp. So ce341]|uniref:hypothetical protein n=1 Tax=Sorangium sp. So ce341 TaxID=3133302 RepID=UPI003F62C52B